MQTVPEIVGYLLNRNYRPNEVIAVSVWDSEDVTGVKEENGWTFTEEERWEILAIFKKREDANVGLNWTSLKAACLEFLEKKNAAST